MDPGRPPRNRGDSKVALGWVGFANLLFQVLVDTLRRGRDLDLADLADDEAEPSSKTALVAPKVMLISSPELNFVTSYYGVCSVLVTDWFLVES